MKRFFITGLMLSSVYALAQKTDSIKLRNQLKEEIKQELRAEFEANSKAQISQQVNEAVAKDDFLTKIKKIAESNVKISGKGTLRAAEQDWNYEKERDVYADDKFWSRISFGVQLDAKIADGLSFTTRLRSGNQQYGFITFGGISEDRMKVVFDKYVLKYAKGNYWVSLGRDTQIWEDQKGAQFDVPTHEGLAVGAKFSLDKDKKTVLEPTAAYYTVRYSGAGAETNGRMWGGQVKLTSTQEEAKLMGRLGMIMSDNLQRTGLTGADAVNAGRYYNTNTGSAYDGDLADAYSILTVGASATFKNLRGLSISGEYYQNLRDYDTNPVSYQITKNTTTGFTPDFTGEKTGYIITASIGNRGTKGDCQVGASYVYLEKYSTQDFMAQWDHAGWAASNVKGFEAFATYQIFNNLEFRTRFFLAKEIKGYNGNDADFERSGNRIRFDLNFKF